MFYSQYATKIWDVLYTVYIPDQITLDKNSIKKFGTYITQNKKVDEMLKTNLVMVMINVETISHYYNEGVEVQITSREDMIKIHKDIEGYLSEWKDYLRLSIHGNQDAINNKNLILSLEKLSRVLYDKAKPRELMTNLFLDKKVTIGILDPISKYKAENNFNDKKPEYEGIKNLIKNKKQNGVPGGRF